MAMLLGLARGVAGQPDSVTVSILTLDAGDIIYELEGHAALRINSASRGDYAIDWGRFDFNSPSFVYRFTAGETDYRCGVQSTDQLIWRARLEGRRLTEYQLNLTPGQAALVMAAADDALRPENRVYRYNYVKDNCSTRVFNLVEKATGDTISFGPMPQSMSHRPTFRKIMRYYHTNYPWYQFGIDLALGSGIDKPITTRQSAFAPVLLERLLEGSTIDGKPLVSHVSVLEPGHPGGVVEPPTPLWLTPLAATLSILIIVAAFTYYDVKKGKRSRWLDSVLYGLFTLLGLMLTFLIFVSVHEATSPNWMYLWLNPLNIIGAVGVWLKSMKRIVFWWQIVNFALLFALLIIGITGVQSLNASFYPLILADAIRAIFTIKTHAVKSK